MSICAPMVTVRETEKVADVVVGRRSYSLATPDHYAAVRQFIEKNQKPLRKMETTAEEIDEAVSS